VNYLVSKVEVPTVPPGDLRVALREEFLLKRKLDAGNPNPGNIGEDFNRLGVDFWDRVIAVNPTKNRSRQNSLSELNLWRNAIAHQDFTPAKLNSAPYVFANYLTLNTVRNWRKACEGLAVDFDSVMRAHIALLIGGPPW